MKQLPVGVLLWRRSSDRICTPSPLQCRDEVHGSKSSVYTILSTIPAVDCGLKEGKRCLERELDEVDVQKSISAFGVRMLSVILLEAEPIPYFPA